jgi:hypothetical protein
MRRRWTQLASVVRHFVICVSVVVVGPLGLTSPARAVVRIFDGFGDADRNNDNAVTGYDTDLNDSGTFNDFTTDVWGESFNNHASLVASRWSSYWW